MKLHTPNNRTLVMIVLAAIVLFSCNPTKRAYKAIEKLPPVTDNDSLRLSKRSLATFPPKPPVLIPGKTITVIKQDSADKYKRMADSLSRLTPATITQIETQYKDTCTSAVSTYNQGYKIGYKIGLYDGKGSCPPTKEITRTDTLQVSDPAQAVQIGQLQIQNREGQNIIDKLQNKVDAKNKLIAWLFGIIGIAGLFIFLLLKRRK